MEDKDTNRRMGNEEQPKPRTERPELPDSENIIGQGEDEEEFEDADDDDIDEDDLAQEADEA